MLVHNLLFGGSFNGKYFQEVVVIVDDVEHKVDHEIYCSVLGQTEEPESSLRYVDIDNHLEDYEDEDREQEKEKIEQWFELGKFDVHTFDIDDTTKLTINVW